jgi:diguanylate cyclase (GGDEF)-like protein/PAS domain S-box-containing protein
MRVPDHAPEHPMQERDGRFLRLLVEASGWYDPDAIGNPAPPDMAAVATPPHQGWPGGGRLIALDPAVLVSAMANAAVVVDHDGRIAAANGFADSLFERSVVGLPVEELVPESRRAAHATLRQASTSTGHSRPMGSGIAVQGVRPNGTTFPAEVSLSSIATSNGPATLAIVVDTSELAARMATLQRGALHDPLTNLGNRAALRAALDAVFALPVSQRPVTALAIDIDGLREANRRFGHGGGDALLLGYAQRLQAVVRPDDFVARIGGDEFVVLCAGPLETGRAVAARLTGPHRERRGRQGAAATSMTASVGIAARRGREGASSLLRRADEALLAAKGAGGCRVVEAG